MNARECDLCQVDPRFSVTVNGSSATFNASATTSTQPIALYVWQFFEGASTIVATSTQPVITHHFPSGGSWSVTLTVYTMYPNGDPCNCSAKFTDNNVEVQDDAAPANGGCCTPVSFDVPYQVCVNVENQFCLTDNCDCLPLTDQTNYTWNFGDNTVITTKERCVSHAFTDASPHTVDVSWVNCDDPDGEPFHYNFDVAVDDCSSCDQLGLIPSFTPTQTGPLTISFDASASAPAAKIRLYIWDFGDGSHGFGKTVSHTYPSATGYPVRLMVYGLDNSLLDDCCSAEADDHVGVSNKWAPASQPAIPNGYLFPTAPVATKNVKKSLAKTRDASTMSLVASPNPFTHSLSVSFTASAIRGSTKPRYTLNLTNGYGATLLSNRITGNLTLQLNTKSYPAGMYVLSVRGSDGTVLSKKVIKIGQ